MIQARTIAFNIRVLLLAFVLMLFALGMQSILISPSHPFIDNNNNGIDDVDEQNEEFKASAQKYRLKFPIADLGGCKNYHECKSFCEDPVNGAACISYAKDKGFHSEDGLSKKKDEIVEKAKKEFGCDSYGSCKAFCEIPTNYEKCSGFAKKNNISGGHVADPQEKKFLDKAKEILGCDSPQACSNFCDTEGNRAKCSEFAKKLGLRGGEERHGPGGCTSEDTCKAFCSDPINFQQCSQFSAGPGGPGGPAGGFRGPGGCNSESSCRNYCETNPKDCRIIAPASLGVIDDPMKAAEEYKKFCSSSPGKCESGGKAIFSSHEGRAEFERFCSANPEKCGAKEYFRQTEGDRKAEVDRYCKDNPDKCKTGPGGYQIPQDRDSGPTSGYIDPKDYCKKFPDRCPQEGDYKHKFEDGKYDPAAMCANTPNCRWEGGTCQCGLYGGPYQTPGTYITPPNPTPYPYQTPGTYQTPSYHYSPPPYQTPGTYQTPYTYQTPGTYQTPYYYQTPSTYQTPYSYQTPGTYQTPYTYHTPSGGYGTPSYGTPSYGTPSYGTPQSYPTPSYGTPSYGTPSYGTPQSYPTPPGGETHGASTNLFDWLIRLLLR